MYVRIIRKDEGWSSWLWNFLGYELENIKIYRRHYLGEVEIDDISEDSILSSVNSFTISKNKLDKIKDNIKDIKLGLTFNNTDTNNLSNETLDMLNMRGVHIALVDYYTSQPGVQYRCHMSDWEKQNMINLFESEQKELSILMHNDFYECDDDLIDEIFEQDVFSDPEDKDTLISNDES
jgi:hypothetical protein